MRLTLFIEGSDAAGAPCVELDHVSAALSVHHACYADHAKSSTLAIHHFTPAHARQLIEMLTPIAAQALDAPTASEDRLAALEEQTATPDWRERR